MSSPSLSEFLSQPEVAGRPRTSSATAAGVVAVSQACRAVAGQLGFGALRPGDAPVGEVNVHGEQQQALDVLAHGLFVEAAEGCSQFAGVLSEESEEVISADPAGTLLLAFDPLDGSSNLEINGPVGSIFSIVERTRTGPVTAEEFLGVGTSQVAAGYALYGSHTVLMVSVGDGVHAFTLGPATGQFRLSGSNVRIPAATQEYAINAANSRFWEPPVARYVAECCAGATGPRGKDFNTRWIAAVVSDTHRILTRGGVFLPTRRSPGVPRRSAPHRLRSQPHRLPRRTGWWAGHRWFHANSQPYPHDGPRTGAVRVRQQRGSGVDQRIPLRGIAFRVSR